MKVGVLGGTFDPIHRGHVYLAREIAALFGLDHVTFVVAKTPPHKMRVEITDAFHRYAMAVLETLDEPGFSVSSLELRRSGPSFTVDTLRELRLRAPRDRFCFIAGSDSLREIHTWKECGSLFVENCLVFVTRPGADINPEELQLPEDLRNCLVRTVSGQSQEIINGSAYLVELSPPPYSSTEIRRLISSGKRPPVGSLSKQVYRYVVKYNLYDGNY